MQLAGVSAMSGEAPGGMTSAARRGRQATQLTGEWRNAADLLDFIMKLLREKVSPNFSTVTKATR